MYAVSDSNLYMIAAPKTYVFPVFPSPRITQFPTIDKGMIASVDIAGLTIGKLLQVIAPMYRKIFTKASCASFEDTISINWPYLQLQ